MKKTKNMRATKVLVAALVAFCCLGCSQGKKDGPQSTSTPSSTSAATPAATGTPVATGTPSATTSSTEDGEWVDTEISNGLLVISAPGELVATDTGDNTIVYATSGEKYAVIVTVGDPIDEEPAAALEMLKAMVIQQAGAEETHSEKTTFEGQPALQFGLKAKDGTGKEIPVEMMTTFVGGNTLIQAAVTDGDHKRFFESFELLEADGAVEEVVEEETEEKTEEG